MFALAAHQRSTVDHALLAANRFQCRFRSRLCFKSLGRKCDDLSLCRSGIGNRRTARRNEDAPPQVLQTAEHEGVKVGHEGMRTKNEAMRNRILCAPVGSAESNFCVSSRRLIDRRQIGRSPDHSLQKKPQAGCCRPSIADHGSRRANPDSLRAEFAEPNGLPWGFHASAIEGASDVDPQRCAGPYAGRLVRQWKRVCPDHIPTIRTEYVASFGDHGQSRASAAIGSSAPRHEKAKACGLRARGCAEEVASRQAMALYTSVPQTLVLSAA